jgi:hypothetical protein
MSKSVFYGSLIAIWVGGFLVGMCVGSMHSMDIEQKEITIRCLQGAK